MSYFFQRKPIIINSCSIFFYLRSNSLISLDRRAVPIGAMKLYFQVMLHKSYSEFRPSSFLDTQ